MNQTEDRMREFQDVISGIENLYVWQYTFDQDTGLTLLSSSCPDEEFWHNVFMFSFSDKVLESCKNSDASFLIGDDIGILWIATPKRLEDTLQKVCLLGPVFTSDTQTFSMNELLGRKDISVAYKRELTRQLERLPAISHSVLCVLGTLQHFCVTNSRIRITDIQMQSTRDISPATKTEPGKKLLHDGAEQEALLLKAIREGNLNYGNQLRENHYKIPGTLAPGNALRQFQDEIITETTLCSRAAIAGGLSREMALTLSDMYIQKIEAATTLPEVGAVHYQMRDEYIRRVHALKHREGLSPAIIACMDYIELHITNRLSVVEVAANTGYADYYISRLFQKEMKQSLSDYIQEKKIEHAAFLLKNSEKSVSDISVTLHYSSPSHFCTVFRKEKGMTPTQYRLEG